MSASPDAERITSAEWLAVFGHRISVQPDGCWLWTGAIMNGGYGSIGYRGRSWQAHRLSWTLCVGRIPGEEDRRRGAQGACVCHRCDVRACVNPAHLFLAQQRVNIQDMENKHRARHPRGSNHENSKLTEADIPSIRWLYATGEFTQAQIAARFGVSQILVSLILRRKAWAHVP